MNFSRPKDLFFSLETTSIISSKGRENLGKGSCGYVKLVRHNNNYSSLFAMKTIMIKNASMKADVLEEIRLHSKLKHPNIIRLYGSQVKTSKILIFLEYAEKGDLFGKVHRTAHIPLKHKLKTFYQCVQAVNYMHEQGVLHRDLKPENILLDENGDVKLCDFGWSIEMSKKNRRQSLCGTVEYMAPEIYNQTKQTEKTDVWALGNTHRFYLY